MQPVEASLIANLVDTIQECQARLFRSYSERMSEDQQREVPSGSMASPLLPNTLFPSLWNHYPSHEETSINARSNFLNAAFQQPPPVQDTSFESSLQSHDPMSSDFWSAEFQQQPPSRNTGIDSNIQSHDTTHSFQASDTVDTSLSLSSNTIFSDHGYGSEQIGNRQSYCNSSSTTISSQSQAANSMCPPSEPNDQGGPSRWQHGDTANSWADDFFNR